MILNPHESLPSYHVEDYDRRGWYHSLRQYQEFNRTAILAAMAHTRVPTSYLDIGCGDSTMLNTACQLGVQEVIGVEVSSYALQYAIPGVKIHVGDLRKFLDVGRFDLVTCIEVAEHLPEEDVEVFMGNVARHVDQGGHLIFTAAPPGQNGYGHVNCQPAEYWQKKLESRGLVLLPNETERLRSTWQWTTGPMFWLPQNVQVYSRPES